jgi:hypothetical protein
VFENELVELDAAGTLAAAEANEHALITAETRRLHIAAHWVDIHPGDAVRESRLPGSERPGQLGGDGTPTVAGFCPAELGCALRMSDGSASRLIAEGLDLRHRLRQIWAAALAGQVPAHQARHIAAATRHLTAAQAGWVDAQLARPWESCPGAGCTPCSTQKSSKPTSRLRFLLGDHCSISLKPVIDLPAGHTPVDSYEIPARLREQLQLRYLAELFPHPAAANRRIDLDHTIPYISPDRGGPPGQTRIGNLGPYLRRHDNHKTHGGWQVRQPEPGTWLWRTPHRRIYLVNANGTHPLGDTEFAQALWRAAARPPLKLATRPS